MKKIFSLVLIAAFAFVFKPASAATVCDTLFNQRSALDTPTLYYADTSANPGFISGNNVWGDLIKAEGFGTTAGYSATSADLFFAYAAVNSADSGKTVKVYVYDNSDTSIYGVHNAPGKVLDSATITLRQIAASITASNTQQALIPVNVIFTSSAPLTDTFYVGVVLPTTTGDTIDLWQSRSVAGSTGNGWEYEANFVSGVGYGWGSYYDDYGFNNPTGNYIVVTVCGNANGVVELDNATKVKIYPNPATDVLNIEFSQQSNSEVTIYDMSGTVVRSFVTNGVMLNTYDVHSLAAGAYIVRVTDKATNENQSILFSKF